MNNKYLNIFQFSIYTKHLIVYLNKDARKGGLSQWIKIEKESTNELEQKESYLT